MIWARLHISANSAGRRTLNTQHRTAVSTASPSPVESVGAHLHRSVFVPWIQAKGLQVLHVCRAVRQAVVSRLACTIVNALHCIHVDSGGQAGKHVSSIFLRSGVRAVSYPDRPDGSGYVLPRAGQQSSWGNLERESSGGCIRWIVCLILDCGYGLLSIPHQH